MVCIVRICSKWHSFKTSFYLPIFLLIAFTLNLSIPMSIAFGKENIKTPNVSGQFYSSDPKELTENIKKYFHDADIQPVDHNVQIVIAPHAGYVYSGPVAAYSFKAVSQNSYKTIIILAPSHFYGFDGISIWEEGGFQTPLGIVDVDTDLAKSLSQKNEKFTFDKSAFEKEHSLEVEIPFLQETFSNFKIVPVILGQASLKTLADFAVALKNIVGDRDDVLIVVSTDLSHYHNDQTARKMDQKAIEMIKEQLPEKIYRECQERSIEMCGCVPVTAALIYAKLQKFDHVQVLNYANSGDVSGDYEKVVGYSSILIYRNGQDQSNKEDALNHLQKKRLVEIARTTLDQFVKEGKYYKFEESDPRLAEEEGAFVTLKINGRLRGCIGNVIGRGPLYKTVRDMAIAAASKDPRFPPVKKDELQSIEVEVSVLSKPQVVKSADEIELGKHGVIVSKGSSHYGLFLPQVADDTGWSKEEFLSKLCSQKAGLSPNAWKDPKTKLEVFTADVFSESELK